MKEKFEILKGLPAYGEMYISIPENGYSEFSEGLVIKFIKKDNTEWIGNFETGSSSFKFAAKLKSSENVLIIACGNCYIMNPEETKPKVEFGHDYKYVFEYKTKFVLVGEYSISIVESIDKIEHLDNLYYDGITNVKLEDENLIGELNSYDSYGEGYKSDFILNLETSEFKEIERIKNQNKVNNQNEISPKDVVENKKWWKFW
ncbi:MAG TPA: hypothetical protein VFS71_19940 [Flavobacterium sp.]|uniref:hypothetical protein n=1 Tax=Flavobacterium sp. TaxID=239 RepID=UPI002DBA2152|nr:hypothetical protein [Flavobacterium sp.]HEU4791967.1 hypothetical protein [Flavobacterium sp.]